MAAYYYRVPEIPLSYSTPAFPALYWPIRTPPGAAQYLYTWTDMWRFTLYWTLLTVGAAHLLVSLYATLMQLRAAQLRSIPSFSQDAADNDDDDDDDDDEAGPRSHRLQKQDLSVKNRKLLGLETPVRDTVAWVWIIPLVYVIIGGLEALLAGSLVGLVVGAVYNAGYYKMSTWMPFIWGMINALVLILSSFRIQGGL